jgi:uncharacterized protein YdeI (YjbR/CyaY-like superfamily)
MMRTNNSADEYINSTGQWTDCLKLLREIFLLSGMTETIKWGAPVYMHKDKNISSMAAFKNYVGIWFYQGALLSDEAKKLVNAQEGVTKALRQWRFSSIEEVSSNREMIMDYIKEAIANSDAGKEIKPDKNKEIVIPVEIQNLLDTNASFRNAFESFSPGKRREFAEHVAQPKNESTRLSRLEKITPLVMQGIGLNDKYKSK